MKNNFRVLFICACCVFGGAALGVVVDRALGGGGRANAVLTNAKPKDVGARASNNGVAKIGSDAKNFPDLAGLNTAAQWQEYIERWLAAGSPEKNQPNVGECLRRWSEADAEGVLAFVHGAKQFPRRNEAYALPLAVIGRENVQRVIGWLQQNLPEKDRGNVAEMTIAEMEDKHPLEAWTLAMADNIPVRLPYVRGILMSMLKTNPAEALRVMDSMPDERKADVAQSFAAAWAGMDSQAALAWCVAQKEKSFANDVAWAMLYYFSDKKPSEFCAAVERLGVTPDSTNYYILLNNLARNDPLVALEVLQKMPKEQMQRYGDSVVRALFQTDADQAVAAAQVLFPEGEREKQIFESYQEWARSDRKAAEEWLAREADSGLREQIKMGQLATNDPAAFLASIGPATDLSGAFMSRCLDDALIRSGFEQSGEALRWLLANPDQITNARLSTLSRHSRESTVPAMIENIPNIPEGKSRDTLIGFTAEQSIRERNWDTAADLLPLVADSAGQDKLRYKIFSGMMSNPSERDAAREWLATQPLSDEVRASWETLAAPTEGATNDGDDEIVEMRPFY